MAIGIKGHLVWFYYTENGTPRGVVALDTQTEEIQCLLVDSAFRRKKIATQLIKKVEVYAKEHNMMRIFATTALDNQATQKLFESLGYDKWLKYNKVL